MQLAGPRVFGPPADPAAARAVLRRAIELGVDHIDTAQFYGPDVVNELIRDALYPYPAGLRIVSKVGARRDSRGAVLRATHPDELRAGVQANLQTLQVDALALVNLRLMGPDAHAGESRWPSSSVRSRPSTSIARSSRSASATQASTRSRPPSRWSSSARSRTPTTSSSETTRTSCASAPTAASPTSLLPDRVALHERAQAAWRGPDDLLGRCEARCDACPDRPGVAAALRPARSAHPGHLVTDASEAEHGRRAHRTQRRGPRRSGRRVTPVGRVTVAISAGSGGAVTVVLRLGHTGRGWIDRRRRTRWPTTSRSGSRGSSSRFR